jgi:argininosuccinate lyase
LKEFQKFSTNIGADVFEALSLEQILASKNQIGGTAPERVFEALEQARESLERESGIAK